MKDKGIKKFKDWPRMLMNRLKDMITEPGLSKFTNKFNQNSSPGSSKLTNMFNQFSLPDLGKLTNIFNQPSQSDSGKLANIFTLPDLEKFTSKFEQFSQFSLPDFEKFANFFDQFPGIMDGPLGSLFENVPQLFTNITTKFSSNNDTVEENDEEDSTLRTLVSVAAYGVRSFITTFLPVANISRALENSVMTMEGLEQQDTEPRDLPAYFIDWLNYMLDDSRRLNASGYICTGCSPLITDKIKVEETMICNTAVDDVIKPIFGDPVEEDLYHLQHNDPCFKFDDLDAMIDDMTGECKVLMRQQIAALSEGRRGGSQQNDPSSSNNYRKALSCQKAVVEQCKFLVRLYLASPLYYGGRGSKCPNAQPLSCEKHAFDVYSQYYCTVSIPGKYWGSSKKRLSDCIKEDYAWYEKRTKIYGAEHSVAETPRVAPRFQRVHGAQHGVDETPRANPQIQRSRRRRSQSPPRGSASRNDRGRTSSRQDSSTSVFGSFTRSRKAKSSSPTRPLLCDFTGS